MFGQAPTWKEVYGDWANGDYTIDFYVRVQIQDGKIV